MPELTNRELDEIIRDDPVRGAEIAEAKIINDRIEYVRRKNKRREHLVRIVAYMFKEQEFPAQFADYVLVQNNKNLKLPPENIPPKTPTSPGPTPTPPGG